MIAILRGNEWLTTTLLITFALLAIAIRLRAARKPVSSAKILIPPIAMSTGFCMFINHSMRTDLRYLGLAFLAGMVFAYPLIQSTKFQVRGENVYVRRSKGFVIVLLCLLAIRVVLHNYISQFLTIPQTASCFFVLAFGMILPWRVVMFYQFRSLKWTPTSTQLNQPDTLV